MKIVQISEVVKKTAKPEAPKSTKGADQPKAVAKAVKAKKNVLRGVHQKRSRKVRTSVQFKRPKTLKLHRSPKYPRKSVKRSARYGCPVLVIWPPLPPQVLDESLEFRKKWCLVKINKVSPAVVNVTWSRDPKLIEPPLTRHSFIVTSIFFGTYIQLAEGRSLFGLLVVV